MENSFFFLLNPLVVDAGCERFEIIPGYYLHKANPEQLQYIAASLDGFSTLSLWPKSHHLGHNCDWEPYNDKGTKSLQPLPLNQWRYWVIGFESQPPHPVGKDNSDIALLQCSANLIKNDLDIGFGFLWGEQP